MWPLRGLEQHLQLSRPRPGERSKKQTPPQKDTHTNPQPCAGQHNKNNRSPALGDTTRTAHTWPGARESGSLSVPGGAGARKAPSPKTCGGGASFLQPHPDGATGPLGKGVRPSTKCSVCLGRTMRNCPSGTHAHGSKLSPATSYIADYRGLKGPHRCQVPGARTENIQRHAASGIVLDRYAPP